jgi:hypothetical protein
MKRKSPPNDREFIFSPDDWPKWPFLPLIKRGPDPACAVIWGDPKDGKVYFVPDVYIFRVNLEDLKTKGVLRSVDDILAEGWVID